MCSCMENDMTENLEPCVDCKSTGFKDGIQRNVQFEWTGTVKYCDTCNGRGWAPIPEQSVLSFIKSFFRA